MTLTLGPSFSTSQELECHVWVTMASLYNSGDQLTTSSMLGKYFTSWATSPALLLTPFFSNTFSQALQGHSFSSAPQIYLLQTLKCMVSHAAHIFITWLLSLNLMLLKSTQLVICNNSSFISKYNVIGWMNHNFIYSVIEGHCDYAISTVGECRFCMNVYSCFS